MHLKNKLKSLLKIVLCVLAVSSSFITTAQYKQLRGSIVDDKGNSLSGVKITNKHDYPLGQSNSSGEYVFNYQIPMGGASPVFYFTKDGYETYYWEYDGQDHKKIVLSEIVVIEYQKIIGKVTDEQNKPLPKVKIYSRSHNIKGNYSSTLSNSKGQFSFSYPLLEKTIKIKFQKAGHKSVFWTYESDNEIKVILPKIQE